MRKHVIDAITKRACKDDRIMLLTGDLGFHVVEGFIDNFPGRYINCGIAEENMTSMAAGLALEGNMVFTYSIGNFPTLRCYEQIRNDVCYHNANVKIIAVGGGLSYGTLGMTHHSTEDLSIMRALPNMAVYAPADPLEADAAVNEMMDSDGPCYIRLAKGSDKVLHIESVITDIDTLVPFYTSGECSARVAIITTGTVLEEGIKAHDILGNNNIDTELYSVPRIKPIAQEKIKELARHKDLLVTIEENNIIGGLGGAVAEVLSEMPVHASLMRMGLQDTFTEVVGSREWLREYYGLDGMSVAKSVMSKLQNMNKDKS